MQLAFHWAANLLPDGWQGFANGCPSVYAPLGHVTGSWEFATRCVSPSAGSQNFANRIAIVFHEFAEHLPSVTPMQSVSSDFCQAALALRLPSALARVRPGLRPRILANGWQGLHPKA
jgi:hypothetical protein